MSVKGAPSYQYLLAQSYGLVFPKYVTCPYNHKIRIYVTQHGFSDTESGFAISSPDIKTAKVFFIDAFYSLRTGDVCMRQWSGLLLIQAMACRVLGTEPFSKPMLIYYQLDPWEITSVVFLSLQIFSFVKIRWYFLYNIRQYVHDPVSWWRRDMKWASYQIRKIADFACAGNAGNDFLATNFNGNCWLAISACITARASRTCRDACRDRLPAVAGKTFPAFPPHVQPTILRMWQEAHDTRITDPFWRESTSHQ